MKLLMVASLKDYQKDVQEILNAAGISVFSVTETVGFKDGIITTLVDNWFSSGVETFDSLITFSFTDEAHASASMKMIKEFNNRHSNQFPLRAFILPVEESSY